MKALAITGKDTVELVDKPHPEIKPNEVLVRIKMAALNHRDQWIRQGMYPNIKYGVTLGSDGFGEVVETGKDVSNQWVGKEVNINPNINWGDNMMYQSSDYTILGMPADGTFAEYLVLDQDRIYEAGSSLRPEEQASIPLAGLTAYRAAFTHGRLNAGQKVLVTGIGGGVAQFAFQFGLSAGADVSVTSGSEGKLEKARQMGASGFYNYKDDGWSKIAFKETGGFDLIIDSTGGSSFSKFIDLIKLGGKIVFYGASSGMPDKVDLFKLFWKQAGLQGSTVGNDQEFGEMLNFIKKHEIRPVVDSVHKVENWKEAFDKMKERGQFGKIVLSF